MQRFLTLAIIGLFAACSYTSTEQDLQRHQAAFVHDAFAHAGDYHWTFQLMGTTQHSAHTFFADSIQYRMTGKVYSTDYTMQKLSYDAASSKWIGQDEAGFVYALFFKDATDSTLTIYKRKCKEAGLEEALAFGRPADDATTDHGWNVYTLGNRDALDRLPVTGAFGHDQDALHLTDGVVTWNGRAFQKLSYHAGERRWVGHADSLYLQVFIQDALDDEDGIVLSVAEHTDMEAAYRTTHATAAFARYSRP
ncbi:MAG: hypothetical protein AAF730_06350 [Bacteroidota bacterium]